MNAFPPPFAEGNFYVHDDGQPKFSGRILVVDDDSDIRFLNTRVLVRAGYRVDAAENGEAGWEALQTIRYNLLITDNKMPRLSGIELVKRLRSAQMRLPVLSGNVEPAEFNQNPWLNIAAMLLKPFTNDQLLQTVKEVLRFTVQVRTRSDNCVAL